MSTLSVFAFERKSFQEAGPFRQSHAKLNGGPGLFWEGMWEIPATHAVFAYVRSATEIAQSLSGALNTDSVLKFVDGEFKKVPDDSNVHPPVRTGPIRTSYATWGDVDKTHVADPSAHQDSELITTISIDFHCNTSPIMTALDGTIVLYVNYYLDGNGKAQVRLEGWSTPVWDEESWRPDFGAAGQVSQKMSERLEGIKPIIQAYLDSALRSFAGDTAYSELYTLPGTGITDGAPFADDADQNVALCLVPLPSTGQSSHGLGTASFRPVEDRRPTVSAPAPVPGASPIA
jgi:hypothetical protein